MHDDLVVRILELLSNAIDEWDVNTQQQVWIRDA